MPLEIVREHAHRLCSPADFAQGLARVLLQRRVGLETALRCAEGLACFRQRRACFRRDLRVESLDEATRTLQHLLQVGANLVEGNLFQLLREAGQHDLQLLQAAGLGGQLRRGLCPVYLGLRRVGEEVEGHVQLTGQQAPGPELGAQPGLDQRVHACPPFARRRLRAAQLAPRPQALRIERDLNRKVDELGCVIEFYPDGFYLTDGDPAEVRRRTHRQSAQRPREIRGEGYDLR